MPTNFWKIVMDRRVVSLLFLLLPVIVSLAWSFVCFTPQGTADVIFSNATIYTGEEAFPWAQAMAVRNGRVLYIGSFIDVEAMAGSHTYHIDLQGKFLVPGFIDSHVHLISGGLQMAQIDLRDVTSQFEFVDKIQLFVQGVRNGQWVLGGGWNNEKWGGELPQACWIDPFTKDIPVWLYRIDGHMGLANSAALRLANLEQALSDHEAGSIVKDKDGGPTGILTDSAMKLVISCIPEVSIQERRDALARASTHALSQGITTVIDFGRFFPGSPSTNVWDDFHEVYKWADEMGQMLLRVSVYFPLETWSRAADMVHANGNKFSQWLRIGGLKTFSDGSLGSNTALFNEPYADDPMNYGLEISSQASMLEQLIEADKRKLQVAVHAIGDAANDKVLTAFQAVIATNGQRDQRFRIEHAQHLSQRAASLFHPLGVIASMQPEHLLDDANYASKKLGEERSLQESYLFKSLLNNGTLLAFGSDWPVAHLNPLKGIRAALERTPLGWKDPWIPSECIDIEAAVKGYTLSAAYASFMDDEIGSLSSGKFADFVVLSENIFERYDATSILATYIGGIEAFRAH